MTFMHTTTSILSIATAISIADAQTAKDQE